MTKPWLEMKAGSKHRVKRPLNLGCWPEPKGAPSYWDPRGIVVVPAGTVITAGLPCEYKNSVGSEAGQWFTDGPDRWFVLTLSPNQTILEPLAVYGPMGALVVDDMSGDDICADA